MEETSSKSVLSGFASYLAAKKLLDREIALNALQNASENKIPYVEFLVQQRLLDEVQISQATAEYFGLPLFDLNALDFSLIPSEFLTIYLVKKKLALPVFKKNNYLYLAVTDPTVEHLYELRFLTGLDTRLLVVEQTKLAQVIDNVLNTLIFSKMDINADEMVDKVTLDAHKENEETDLAAYDVESAPVVNYVNRILLDAIEKRASDIHFEHYENLYRVRFRQHGVLYQVNSPPLKLANYLLARIKVMSNLDITEHRVPQDGRFKLILSKKRAVDFRVSVCPTLFGEKIVLRILDTSLSLQKIEALGMNSIQTENYLSALQRSQGMILVTGPTGSGKTVSLYAGLNYLNSPEKNISTVEDPVEIPLQGVNQVNVSPKTGLTFSTALRSFLRQDPDIIMVGEIRDLETAEIAVKAAQTGHLVLSTLHTNSAPETITRLMNMGIAPYNLASSLAIIIAQRLVRVLCDECKKEEEITPEILLKEGFNKDEIGTFKVYAATGCDHCIHGFKGRMGIFEVMPISSQMSELIMRGGNAIETAQQARAEKINTLREAGLQKVKEGVTSLSELNRVFK